ncbi:aldehyde dehydrogenase family protein [Sphingomonas hengshuiensis]|uniref:aldehyde dehydrogenase family protein n=1 Tax=Sphingomonas hengshuiensis TaxID=1609977 RepID=UPI000B21E0BC|nr:aldehyde dehydrogenase family protein [Sphingomonas hengshuiensis]
MNADRFHIAGRWVEPLGTERIAVYNPADLTVLGHAVMANEADADRAVAAARTAFAKWQGSSREERIALIRRMRAAFEQLAPELERHLVREIGITTMVAQGQTRMTLSHFDGMLEVLPGYAFSQAIGDGVELVREPIGVVAAITSWNAPVSQMLCKAVPAIAAGCAVVIKPSEQAPLCAMLLAEAMARADIPPGLLNILNGRGHDCGRRLAEHPDVDMVSFTGSVAGGGAMAAAAAPTIKRVHQELGGKSPNILLPDADFAEAVPKGVLICMMAAGQACAAPTRMIVPEDRFEHVAALAVAAAQKLAVGPPDQPGIAFGPLANEAQFRRVNAILEKAIADGQPLLAGGPGRPSHLATGYYIAPTIFGPVSPDAGIARDEIFGPVLCILTYRDMDEAIRIANATEYGLSAYIESADPAAARRIAGALRAGYVNINYPPWSAAAPFGGFKRSGNGKQYGVWGFEEFLETKAIVG